MIDLRTEYLARFGALPTVAHCAAHDGELDDEEVSRVGVARTPAVLVTCLGSVDADDDTGAGALLRWVAVVIARGPDAVREGESTSGDLAALIALRIAAELSHGPAFARALDRPSDVRTTNLVGAKAARRGYRLWAVTWVHAADLPADELDADLDRFELLRTISPTMPADIELEQPPEVP